MKNKPVPQLAKYDPKKGRQMTGYLLMAIPAVIGLSIVRDIMTTVFTPQPTEAELELQESTNEIRESTRQFGCSMIKMHLEVAKSKGDTANIEKYSKSAKENKCFDLSSYR